MTFKLKSRNNSRTLFKHKNHRRLNIIFLTSSMQIGGQEQYIAQQIINIDKSKFNPVLCCLKNSGAMAERVCNAGIKIVTGFQRFKYDIYALWRFYKFLRYYKPEILYIFDFRNVLFIGRLAGLFAKIPLVVIACHKMNLNGTGLSYGLLDRALMPLCDHVIAAANIHKDSLIKNDGINPSKVTAIYNGIQLSRLEKDLKFKVTKQDFGILENSKIIGTIARLSLEKSQEILLEAASIVINCVENTHLLIIGDGPERNKLEKKAIDLRIKERVHFLGFKKRVAPIVKLFDVFALSSTSTELFSAATLEAMSLGVPVVVTDVGGMSEMVLDGITGHLVPPYNANILAERILELLTNPNKAKEYGNAAKKRVEENFAAIREIRQIEKLLLNLLAFKKDR